LGSADFDDGTPDADAVIGTQAGDICVVQTADCLPVLLCASDGQEIAAVHAGWRGLAAGIIEATVARMTSTVSDLIVWLGPAISQAAFEVGDEVRQQFRPWSDDDNGLFVPNDRGRWQADLFGLASARLEKMGVRAIYGERLCTYDDPDRFFSYRRDGKTGRLLNFIYRS
jgi:YfiH family protein